MPDGAGKGPDRRSGDNAKDYRKNLTDVKGMDKGPDIEKKFEESFMGKTAEEKEPIINGKHFIG